MTNGAIAKLDERGRVIIPAPFREALALKDKSNVLLRVDAKNKMLTILPFAVESDELATIELAMGDAPGTLARILALISSLNIDLIRSESTAQERGRLAEWNAVLDFSKSKSSLAEVRKKLLKDKLAREVKIEKL